MIPLVLLLLSHQVLQVSSQTTPSTSTSTSTSTVHPSWCGKHYTSDAPREPPHSPFPTWPVPSNSSFSVFQRFSFDTSASVVPSLVLELNRSFKLGSLEVLLNPTLSTTTNQSQSILIANVSLDASRLVSSLDLPLTLEIPLSWPSAVTPSFDPFPLSARFYTSDSSHVEHVDLDVFWFPAPSQSPYIVPSNGPSLGIASMVKLDRVRGLNRPSLVVETLDSDSHQWTCHSSFYPYGQYIDSRYLMADIPGNLRDISKEDHTLIHPVPPFELSETPYNLINSVFDEAASKNLFMQYDMRHSFTDPSSVTDQVLRFREKKSLAFWYTADEPDGTSIDWRLVQNASDIIKHLDPYHPTTLVLNCNTHGVQTYSRSVDIVMTDVYPISNNLTFSSRWNTPCTTTFGCCGCDACVHNGPRDVFDRLKMYDSLKLGKSVWMVVQGFGGSEYWERVPTPEEVRAMVYAGVVRGASGILYWLRIVYELVDVIAEVGRELKALSPVLTGYVWYGDAILERDEWVVGSVWADVKLGVSGNIEVKDSVSRKEWAVDYDVGWKHIVAVVVNLSTSDTIAFEDGKVCSKELKGIDGIAHEIFPSHRGLTKQGTEEDKEDDVNQVIVKDGCFHIHHMKPLEVIILEIKA